ncbi:PREDICTED: putative late blight resistance protein homolog R1B-17 [Ipomoea nil]|uniref:putative late blight resistance protein homolog R1B-17 n=1 Tax=Ipomoea nil TaxID=35883 RepID=UPI0009016667|nr:PREDICTED: putative late blight resistance protein homolog R1B-17 [Ipomoea nil]
MASAALTSLIATLDLETERVPDIHVPPSLSATLDSLFLLNWRISDGVAAAAIKDLETKIKDFALQVEDDFEIQLSNFLHAQDTQSQQKASMQIFDILIQADMDAQELLSFIKRNIYRAFAASEFQPAASTNPRLKHYAPESSKTKRVFEEYKMVGRQHDYGVIKDRLLCHNDKLKVISIVGMAGIGKTTLAVSLYGDPQVASHFKARGWVTMPHQEYQESQLLWDLLESITLALAEPNEVEKGSCGLTKLAEQVRKCLLGKRYLIVLDNFWKECNYIQDCFPDDTNGSCILLTSYKYLKSGYFKSSQYDYVHHKMTLLGSNESWDLFCNILSLNGCVVSKFEKIRVDVVEKCDGLPQSIAVVAERLSKCNIILKEWEKIEKELELLGTLDRSALTHHYNQLPHHLKVCFLYLAVFPRRSKIQVKVLIRLWIAEGFVKQPWSLHGMLEDEAYCYLEQLILNSLLLIDNQSFDGKIKSCRMHSALHSFCIREAQKEGIFCALNIRKYPTGIPLKVFANSCRWLSLYSHNFDYYVLFRENNSRSILFFNENPEMFISFKLLRVLAFVPSSFLQRAPMRLSDLVFLRYLSVTQWFEGLNCIVSTNMNLRTLVVSGNESQLGAPTIHLPCEIWDLPQLRHLELGNMYALDPPFQMEDRKFLQTLSWASPTLYGKEAYCNFRNLRKLKIFYRGGSCSNNNPLMLDSIDYLKKLEKLTISVLVGCTITLPEQCMFPLQLKKLGLSETNLRSWDLSVISMLPQLEVLKLENAIHGNIWEVDKGGFNKLRFLLIEDRKLEQLKTYLSCFKCLERLVLRLCCCLEEISWFLAFHVESIELERCHPSLIEAAMQIQEAGKKILKRKIEIIIRGPEYDESQNTHKMEVVEDDFTRPPA